jgi:hypothetical protein
MGRWFGRGWCAAGGGALKHAPCVCLFLSHLEILRFSCGRGVLAEHVDSCYTVYFTSVTLPHDHANEGEEKEKRGKGKKKKGKEKREKKKGKKPTRRTWRLGKVK